MSVWLLALLSGCSSDGYFVAFEGGGQPVDEMDDEPDDEGGSAEILVLPCDVDFGDREIGTVVDEPFDVVNTGSASAEAWAYVRSEGAVQFSITPSYARIPAEDGVTFIVSYAPIEPGLAFAEVVFDSNDADVYIPDVPVSGNGVDPSWPDIHLYPGNYDFFDVPAGTSVTGSIEIRNPGGSPLHLDQAPFSGSIAFEVLVDLPDLTVYPDEEIVVPIVYTPTHEDGDAARIDIHSDDPDEPIATLSLSGNGG